jgi:hypothetical protein
MKLDLKFLVYAFFLAFLVVTSSSAPAKSSHNISSYSRGKHPKLVRFLQVQRKLVINTFGPTGIGLSEKEFQAIIMGSYIFLIK